MFKEKIIIEGIMPERALSRLQRAGICVYYAKKIKKNQILLSVKRKDAEKVFAIYPNLCYNISVYGAYKAKYAGEESVGKLLFGLKNRMGLVIGGALFLAAVIFSQSYVFRIDVVGNGGEAYRRDALIALEEKGIKPFSRYVSGREGEVCAALLKLPDVSYCSVKKTGMAVRVEIRLNAFSEGKMQEGDMCAEHTGRIEEIAVLRGTPLKKAGDEIAAGEPLVGAYLFLSGETGGETAGGKKVSVAAIARVKIRCVFEAEISADSEEAAFAHAYLKISGGNGGNGGVQEIVEKTVLPTENEGRYAVKLVYMVTEAINFN